MSSTTMQRFAVLMVTLSIFFFFSNIIFSVDCKLESLTFAILATILSIGSEVIKTIETVKGVKDS